MPKVFITRLIRLALAAAFTIAFADRAAASSIRLFELDIQVTEEVGLGLVANLSAELQAESSDGSAVLLNELFVELFEDGVILDLGVGPTLLDSDPFFALPPLAHGAPRSASTLLFRITGLAPGAAYTGWFALSEPDGGFVLEDLVFAAPATVPEPATLVLTGFGMAALLRKRLRKRGV